MYYFYLILKLISYVSNKKKLKNVNLSKTTLKNQSLVWLQMQTLMHSGRD